VPDVPADETLVWLADAGNVSDTALAYYAGWLGADECLRAGRFVRPARRRHFILGRALLRLALARLLGLAPHTIGLLERPGAAPMLCLDGHEGVGFSISHSGRWVGCAASLACRVGFDIEVKDQGRNLDALAEQAFDEEQRSWLASRPPDGRVRDFYTLWSTAEARFKLGAASAAVFEFQHPELSVVLCSEQVLARQPAVELVMLSGPNHVQ
jgi:4'-phosphopantetheinyl transferase